jgi:fucose 4-O-acetylase-like acetyltransferase
LEETVTATAVSPARVQHAPAAAPTTAQRPARDPWFDNAKMLLVTLVVIGHSWTLLPETWLMDRTYNWLYLWHVPAFVLVTGYLARRFTYSRRNLRKLVTTVALPYLVFEGMFALFRVHVGGETLERLWLNPHWPLWYLSVLFMWRLVTPALRRLPWALPVTVAVSLLGGLVDLETFDINRALGLLPFFAAGVLAGDRVIEAVRTPAARRAALVVLPAALVVSHLVESRLASEWLYYRTSYAALDTGALEGMAIRLGLMVVAFAMVVSVLAWIPGRGGWFSALGAGSLVVYLFHGFFVKGAEYAGFEDWAGGHALLSFVLATVVSLGLALTLSWRPVRKPLEKVVTPAP